MRAAGMDLERPGRQPDEDSKFSEQGACCSGGSDDADASTAQLGPAAISAGQAASAWDASSVAAGATAAAGLQGGATGPSPSPPALRHNLSFLRDGLVLPPYPEPDRLKASLQNLYSWKDFDVFELDAASDGRGLYTVCKAVWESEGFLEGWRLDRTTALNYLAAAQHTYLPGNPYHNAVHAADVTQAVATMVQYAEREGVVLTKLEKFAVLLAAAVHDLAHPGLTNEFLSNTGHRAALIYNDRSVNENFHASCAFRLAQGEGMCLFAGFTREEYKELRRLVISCVLMTDMSQHFELLEQFSAQRAKQPNVRSWEKKDVLLQLMLHTADISNPFRGLDHATRWGELVTQEFIKQGELERSLGLPLTPACDKDAVIVSTSQLRFAKWFVKPLMEEFRFVSCAFSDMALDLLAQVEAYWGRHEQLAREGAVHPHKRTMPPSSDYPHLA